MRSRASSHVSRAPTSVWRTRRAVPATPSTRQSLLPPRFAVPVPAGLGVTGVTGVTGAEALPRGEGTRFTSMPDPAHNGHGPNENSPVDGATDGDRSDRARRPRPSLSRTVRTLDAKEQRVGYVTAAGTAVVFAALLIPLRNTHPKNPGPLSILEILFVFLGLAVLIAIGTAMRRRASLGFSLVLTGVATFGMTPILALPYLGVFIWLIVRAHRAQLAAAGNSTSLDRSSPGPGRTPPAGSPGARRRRSGEASQARGGWGLWRRRAPEASTVRRAGTQSKRYTPPKRRPGSSQGRLSGRNTSPEGPRDERR